MVSILKIIDSAIQVSDTLILELVSISSILAFRYSFFCSCNVCYLQVLHCSHYLNFLDLDPTSPINRYVISLVVNLHIRNDKHFVTYIHQ